MSHSLSTKLEVVFNNILTQRMRDVPIVNVNLTVKAIGFHEWNHHHMGILITPWFMNIMLIPNSDSLEETDDVVIEPLKVGATRQHVFPSGSYEFVGGYEEELGHYQSCSLFSPMFEFEEQDVVELTAKEALSAIMDSDNVDNESQNPSAEIAQIWNGEIEAPKAKTNFDGSLKEEYSEASVNETNRDERRSLSERLQEPTSRRDFLRGNALKDEPAEPTNSQQRDI